jgi:hypothetical protein
MRFKSAVLGFLIALTPALPVMAQAQSPGGIGVINFQHPKPGMAKQYEAARKKHMAWHKSQKDAWAWFTWEVTSGEETGTYLTGSFGHAWKDFDDRVTFDKADDIDIAATVTPTLAHSTLSYFQERTDLSLSPSVTPGSTPPAMLQLGFYLLRTDGVNDFVDSVKKINEGIKKTNYAQTGPSHWYQLVNGGEGPFFVLVSDRANWAAFQPNAKTLDAMMEEAYGKEQGAAILATLRKSFRSVHTSAHTYRPDLSYIPAK